MDPLEKLVCRITGAKSAKRGERIQSLWGGYGELLRMELAGTAQSHVVVKHAQPPQVSRGTKLSTESAHSHARKLRSYGVEKLWYERFAERCDERCRVPRSLGCRNDGGNWVFVLEDLDVSGLRRRVAFPSAADVALVIRWLAAFHATFFEVGAAGLWSVGTYWHLGTRQEELGRMRDQRLRANAARLDARLAACKHKTLVHGDAKVENFCFGVNPNRVESTTPPIAAVDFQYVGGGCGMKDLAYFFSSIWESADCDAYAEDALTCYFAAFGEELARRSPLVTLEPIEREWRELYPVAWADFHRFLTGWAPGHYDDHPYALRMVQQAISRV